MHFFNFHLISPLVHSYFVHTFAWCIYYSMTKACVYACIHIILLHANVYIICDWIWENAHSSHIQFFSFKDS